MLSLQGIVIAVSPLQPFEFFRISTEARAFPLRFESFHTHLARSAGVGGMVEAIDRSNIPAPIFFDHLHMVKFAKPITLTPFPVAVVKPMLFLCGVFLTHKPCLVSVFPCGKGK